jgi:hypothetical protein
MRISDIPHLEPKLRIAAVDSDQNYAAFENTGPRRPDFSNP